MFIEIWDTFEARASKFFKRSEVIGINNDDGAGDRGLIFLDSRLSSRSGRPSILDTFTHSTSPREPLYVYKTL